MSKKVDEPHLVDGLFQLAFLLYNTLSRIAAEHDLSIVQVRLLGILRDREPGMFELAQYLELEKSSLSGLIDRAGMRGLVTRIPSRDDRRAARIRVTAQGRKLSRVVETEVNAEVEKLIGGLTAPDRTRLASLLSRVVTTNRADHPAISRPD
jgi:DNA-binding MarR family transcriptional regulator